MFKSLYARLAVVLAALLVGVGAVVGAFALNATGTFIQELDQRLNRDLARELLVRRDMVGEESLDAGSVQDLFSYYMHINPAIEIYLLDTDGRVLAFAAPQRKIKRERVDLAPIRRFLEGAAPPILGDDPRDRDRQKVFSAAPFPLDGEPRQYLYVVLGGEAQDSVRALLQESYIARFTLLAVAAVVVFGVLVGAFAFHQLTRRLHHLTGAMEGFRASGFREHRPYRAAGSGDEIDRLGDTFNVMAGRIIEQVQALEEKDALRRNLVANVSHDLRTPLAALQGYLETLQLKTDGLTEAERQQYLATAHRQSERLTRLVGELFELSKLDAREAPPEPEPFALGELVADVGQKFERRAEAAGLALELAVEPDLPRVQADLAMLNRVLENLLENACRHTPEGGTVRLCARAAGSGIEVAVENSGAGIAPDELPHVFERFYQAPEKRRGGAGLGLAIVKRILDLHHVDIEVTSVDGRTVFRFVLPVMEK